ncbi:hypothetical protein PhCBS80983_g05768 [Powellomyces hirtus]|uniref:Transmembrane 9 superfamily member n=1 Tax=Powellomyces hirtus TaxID=109895 RepID=A0A507DU24_9FUNG|nr:hypothetical protein PhCBS80983_g05768 [Powellomyces hirtus]
MRWTVVCLILALILGVHADEHSHKYEVGDEVVLWFNTVGPYDNLQESYEFLSLPFCVGKGIVQHHHETLGEALLGMQLTNAGVDIKFREDIPAAEICIKDLTEDEVGQFRHAVANGYYYQMFLDGLPLGAAFIGEKAEGELYLYTHKTFTISYNADQIIQVNMTSGNKLHLPQRPRGGHMKIPFTISVQYVSTTESFDDRFNKYLDKDFFEHKIHWFSIANSFMMVLFLFGLVTIILIRTLRRDYARYDREEGLLDLDRDLGDDYGWKQVHGDVFRSPSRLTILATFIGTGLQLIVLALCMIVLTILADLYLERATILTVTIFIYALTSMLGGYVSGSFYCKYGGRNWVRTMVLTAAFWPATVALVVNIVNFAAISITSSRAIPFGTMMTVVAIWAFLVFPLTLIGYIVGKNFTKTPEFPCRVNPIPRPIPDKIWYAEPWVIVSLAGVFPFASIFIELYFVFQSFWTVRIYYVYGFMFLVFIMLLIVAACVSIVSTYLLLNNEDHRWQWTSFLSSGSTAMYVFGYSIYYFHAKTMMYGYFQSTWYFGYTALLCCCLFLLLGTVGHYAAEKFVRRIYRNVKID